MAISLGGAGVVYGVLSYGAVVAQSPSISAWWTVPALVLTFGVPVLMGAIAPWSALQRIRLLASITAIGYLLALATLESALHSGFLGLDLQAPWILGVSAPAAIAAAIAWRPMLVWPYVAIVSLLVGVDRALAAPQSMVDVSAQDAIVALLMAAIFAALALATIRAGRLLDRSAESAAEEASRRARLDAERRERVRAEGFIHDGVLATLLVAGNDDPGVREEASARALAVLAQLHEFGDSRSQAPALTAQNLVWNLQATTTETAPEARFEYVVDSTLTIPDAAARAIAEATAEALTNSVRHGGRIDRPVDRLVRVEIVSTRVQVDVLDNGPGFDPTAVEESRLGIALSIRERMTLLSGGSATVVSQPGDGTRVHLEWDAL